MMQSILVKYIRKWFDVCTKSSPSEKNIEFKMSNFTDMLRSVGKIAFDTLLVSNPLLKRSDVVREVGNEPFDYGLLIGHEDFRLIRDETADIFLTFPHRSLKEFLGAFYFILMLNYGVSIESLLGSSAKKPIFLLNPLFLHFCLWLIKSGKTYFTFQERKHVYYVLMNYARKIIGPIFDLKLYPAINITEKNNDMLGMNFLKKILSRMHDVHTLIVDTTNPIDWILTSMKGTLSSVKRLIISEVLTIAHCKTDNYVSIVLGDENFDTSILDTVWQHLKNFNERSSICLTASNLKVNLSRVDIRTFRKLQINGDTVYNKFLHISSFVTAKGILYCPDLTHLSLANISLREKLISSLSSTAAIGGFSNISHLVLVNCRGLARQIGSLFTGRSSWKQLKHLNLYRSIFSRRDLEALFNVIVAGSTGSFPELTSLAISANDETPLDLLLQASSITLTQLFLDTTNVEAYEVAYGKMPLQNVKSCRIRLDFSAIMLFKSLSLHGCLVDVNDLSTITKNLNHDSIMRLDFSRNTAIRENLSKLLSHTFSSLHTLVLSDCGLTSEDLSSLRLANISSKLPELKHLDISKNSRSDFLTDFCSGQCQWNNLISLNIQGTGKGQVRPNTLTFWLNLTV